MSRIIAAAAIRGAHKIVERAEKQLVEALENYGPDRKVEFPNTGYYLPVLYGILGLPVETLGQMRTALEEARKLLPPHVEDHLWLPYLGHVLDAGMATYFAAEVTEALKYLPETPPYLANEPNPVGDFLWLGAANDVILRERGIQFVDGTAPGFAAVVGAAPTHEIAVQIARELQEKNLYVFLTATSDGKCMAEQLAEAGVQMGWETRLVPFGRDLSATVFDLGFATRAALSFGGISPGDYRRVLLYNKNRIFAFVLALGPVDDEKYAYAAGAINWGFPTIADTDIPQILPTGVCTYEHVVSSVPHDQIVSRAVEVRGLKVQVTEVPIPVKFGPAFEGEVVRREDMYAQFGGKYTTAFEFLRSREMDEVEDHQIELVGPDVDTVAEGGALPLGILVEVAGRGMQTDFEPILERRVHTFINEANGIWHMGQRDINWLRISKEAYAAGFRLRHFGEILWAKLHDDFGAIVDKVQVTIYTNQEDVERLLPTAQEVYRERDERVAGMTDESVETLYSCQLCVAEGETIVLPDGSFKRVEDLVTESVEERPQVLSFDGQRFVPQRVGELFINPAPQGLRRVWLTGGNSLTLTPNHKVLVDTETGLEWIKVAHLKPQDRLVSTATTCPNGTPGLAEPWIVDYLPDDIKVFDEDLRLRLREAILSRYGTWATAARELNLDYDRLYSAFYVHEKIRSHPRLKLGEVKDLCAKVGLDWEAVKRGVREFGISHRARLTRPIIDTEFMYAAGLVASDGHLVRRGDGSYVGFTNTEPELVERFNAIMGDLFDVEPKTQVTPPSEAPAGRYELEIHSQRDSHVAHIYSQIAGRLLLGLGIGREASREEKWTGETISTFSPELVAAFLRGLFDGDGHVTDPHILISTGNYREAQHALLLLKKLGIGTYLSETTRGFQVGTRGGRDYLRFRELISSEHPEKRAKMEAAEPRFDNNHVSRTDALPLACGQRLQELLQSAHGRVQITKLPVDYKTLEAWTKGESRASKEKMRLVLNDLVAKVPPDHPALTELQAWCDSTFTVEKVERVEVVENGHRPVYNFSVQDHHNYLVNGIVAKNCQSFAPNHVCIISPERLGLCGAYNYLDAAASNRLNPSGPNQPVPKGRVIDPVKGQWEGVNAFVYETSHKYIERFNAYSMMEDPMTSCLVGDTAVIIDHQVVRIGDFVDAHRGDDAYAKSRALTLNGGQAAFEPIVAMQRFPAPDSLIRVQTKSGAELTLTANHKVAINRPEGLTWVRADAVRTGDQTLSLRKIGLPLESTRPLQPGLAPDYFLDPVTAVEGFENRGKYRYVYNLTLKDIHAYFAQEIFLANCGCFECIVAIVPEANGVAVVNREYPGDTPMGMRFTTLAGSVGGGLQTPGFIGVGRLYLTSKKFISADGGLPRIVWMPRELKEAIRDRLQARAEELGLPDFPDKIADETIATTPEELLVYLEQVGHPALAMEMMF